MNYSLTVRAEAELDISSAFQYFENQRLGLGHDFLLCIEEGLSKIERNPYPSTQSSSDKCVFLKLE